MSNQIDLLIPSDFPQSDSIVGAVSGAAPKVLLVKDGDRFWEPGRSPAECYQRWLLCEDLAVQLTETARISKAGKRAHMDEVDILDQYLLRLMEKNWASPAECRWIVRRAAMLLSWPVPVVAQP